MSTHLVSSLLNCVQIPTSKTTQQWARGNRFDTYRVLKHWLWKCILKLAAVSKLSITSSLVLTLGNVKVDWSCYTSQNIVKQQWSTVGTPGSKENKCYGVESHFGIGLQAGSTPVHSEMDKSQNVPKHNQSLFHNQNVFLEEGFIKWKGNTVLYNKK